MKATELMIGDWVLYNTTPKRIGGIDGKIIRFFRWDVWENPSAIEPIPLTAEILEKNLSTTSQIQYCWDDFLSNSFGEDFYEMRYHGDVTELVISIRYVHELQHVLKLCKIEKEVVL